MTNIDKTYVAWTNAKPGKQSFKFGQCWCVRAETMLTLILWWLWVGGGGVGVAKSFSCPTQLRLC